MSKDTTATFSRATVAETQTGAVLDAQTTAEVMDRAEALAEYSEYVDNLPADPHAASTMLAQPEADAAKLRARMARDVEGLKGRLTNTAVDHIKFKGAQSFLFPDDTITRELTVVIVGFTTANAFYESAFQPGKISPPACYAIDRIPTQMSPRENSPKPQATDCNICPKNQFKSASNGKGKACRNARRMYVIVMEDGKPVDRCQAYTLEAPPTSLRAFDRYVSDLASRYSVLPLAVRTRITLDPDQTYAKLAFETAAPLTDNEIIAVYGMVDGADEYLNRDIDFSAFEN